MNMHALPLTPKPRGKNLVAVCEEKLVQATRDLAYLTPQGINAQFIAQLSTACQALRKQLNSHTQIPRHYHLEQEVWEKLQRVCETGKSVWQQNMEKRKAYELNFTG